MPKDIVSATVSPQAYKIRTALKKKGINFSAEVDKLLIKLGKENKIK